MDYIHVLNLTIPAAWPAFLVAIFVATIVHRFILQEKIGDWLSNAIFYYLIIWKGSYIFFHFQTFIKSPIAVLYFNGGWQGHFLALVLIIFYLSKRDTAEKKQIFAMTMLFIFLYEVVLSLLQQQVLFAVVHGLLVVLVVGMLKRRRDNQLFLLLFMLQLLTLSLQHTLTWTTFITMAILLSVAMYFQWKEANHA